MHYLKKFESFNETSFQEVTPDWFNGIEYEECEEFSEQELDKLREFLNNFTYSKAHIFKVYIDIIDFIKVGYGLHIVKTKDEWFGVRYYRNKSGFVKNLKCDQLNGVFDCINYLKDLKN